MQSEQPAVELLDDAERSRVLQRLLQARPELQADIDRLALAVLTELDRYAVADQVQDALESISTGDVAAVSGKQRGGYVDHYEASTILLEQAVEPFLERLRRLAEAGHPNLATEAAIGILRGLERAEGDEECAIYFDDQFAEILAEVVTAEIEQLGLDIDHRNDPS